MTGVRTRPLVGIVIIALVVGAAALAPAKLTTAVIGLVVVIALTTALARLFWRSIPDAQARSSVRRAFYVGLAIRLIAAPAFYLVLVAAEWNGPGLFWDDEKFFSAFARDATSFKGVWDEAFATGPQALYLLYEGTIAITFDDANVVIRTFNAVLAALSIAVVGRLAFAVAPGGPAGQSRRQSRRLTAIAAWITALSPEWILFSVALTREWLVGLLLAAAVLAVHQLHRRGLNAGVLVAAVVVIGVLVGVRSGTAAVLLGLTGVWVVGVVLFAPAVRMRAIRSFGVVLVLTVLAAGLLAQTQTFAVQGAADFNAANPSDWYSYFQGRYVTTEETGLRTDLIRAQAGTFLEGTVLAGQGVTGSAIAPVKLLTNPSPLWWAAVQDFWTGVQFLPGLAWYALMPLMVAGGVAILRKPTPTAMLVLIVGGGALLMTLSPLGLGLEPLRARIQLHPLLYILAATGATYLAAEPGRARVWYGFVVPVYLAIAMFYYLGLLLPAGVLGLEGMRAFVLIGLAPLFAIWYARNQRVVRSLIPRWWA